MPTGNIERFRIVESPIVTPEVAAELPGLKTFSGQGIDNPTSTARFDWTPLQGFHGYVLSENGTIYIDPLQANDRENYFVYYKHEYGSTGSTFHCKLDENHELNFASQENSVSPLSDFGNVRDFRATGNPSVINQNNAPLGGFTDLRTYRIAIAGTGEYTVNRGGQAAALTAVMTALNRLIGIYRRDAGITFTLVSGTNILFPDGATDPYANDGSGAELALNQTQLNTIIGTANYDVGHLFETSNGGIAATPSVCNVNFKAEGLSGLPNPTGDPFVVDYVAHELGHQFSGQHSYNNSGDGGCTTRSTNNAFEPASGATIMSYVGICNPRNLQSNSYDLFSSQSLVQVINERNNNSPNRGGSCGTNQALGNTPPVIAGLTNFTIPKNTPFALTASATDNDPANQLTYSWEENDLGAISFSGGAADSDADGTARPIFRMQQPTNAGRIRNFPSLTYILNNANVPPATYTGTSPTGNVCNFGNCITGEILPSIARAMSFRVTVRDNNATAGASSTATMNVTVSNNGPFQVTTQNTLFPVTWNGLSNQTVTWNVNGSNAEAPNVNILLSTDGGNTFPTTLVSNIPNNGSRNVTVPNVTTTQARIKVEAVGNIFFDINDVNFSINSVTAASANVGGRVLTANSAPLRNITVSLTNADSGEVFYTRTNARGNYRFLNIPTGLNYVVSPIRAAYNFSPQYQSFTHFGENNNFDFVAAPPDNR